MLPVGQRGRCVDVLDTMTAACIHDGRNKILTYGSLATNCDQGTRLCAGDHLFVDNAYDALLNVELRAMRPCFTCVT